MNSKINQRIDELRDDRLHGAGWLSRQAINILNLAIKESRAETADDLITEITMIASEIKKSRPSMISISNYISRFAYQITLYSKDQKQLHSLKNFALATGDELIKLSEGTAMQAANHSADIIDDKDIIMTCSYSSIICNTFETARNRGVIFHVIIAESRYKNNAYGEISAEQIRQYKIPVSLIGDEDIDKHVYEANKAMVGADSILADGSLINGTPTYILAQSAAAAEIPFYSVCETVKFDPDHNKDNPLELEPGFDIIAPNMLTGIITEAGMIQPCQVTDYLK